MTLIGTGKVRGGKVNIDRLADYLRRLRHLDWCYFTTMLDFDTFHELKQETEGTTPWQRVDLQKACLREILERENVGQKFIPYLQLHDFEALVLAEPEAMKIEFPEKKVGKPSANS